LRGAAIVAAATDCQNLPTLEREIPMLETSSDGAAVASHFSGAGRIVQQLSISREGASWVVRGDRLPRTARFPTREQAIGYARHWASDHRPSLVTLEVVNGEIAGEWGFEKLQR
jgi:hypothetical protein